MRIKKLILLVDTDTVILLFSLGIFRKPLTYCGIPYNYQ